MKGSDKEVIRENSCNPWQKQPARFLNKSKNAHITFLLVRSARDDLISRIAHSVSRVLKITQLYAQKMCINHSFAPLLNNL